MELDKVKAFFEMKDSIMEATLPSKMREFIGKGGQPQVMVKLLAGHYRGLAQMSNLISDWLLLAGMDETDVNTLIEDELKQLILQSFDPKKADTIFREGSQGAPDWLLRMIKQPQWRNLIYQLAETHKNCLLLNFAIQRISDEGYQNEIASLVDQSTYFGVFNRVLKETLLNLFKCDESTLPQHLSDFKKMSSSSEHTYFYTQTLLSALATEEHSLKRLIQELETSVVERGRIVQSMSLLFSSLSEFPQISSSITAMVCDRVTTPGDVLVLYNAYSQANPPPVEFIRNPILLDLLVNDLFNPSKSVNSTYLSKYFYILAYASTHDDNNIMEDEELKATIRGLSTAQEICHKNSYGIDLQHAFPELKETLIYPVVSMGILHWIKCNLADSEYYRTTSHTFSIPIKFQLLRDINERYPLQRSKIMDILSTSFTVETGLDALASLELKKKFIDVMIDLMKTGYALPVMNFIEQMAAKTDQSLIRYFILQLMDIIEPPYSQEFLNSLLALVEKPETIEALKSTDKKELLFMWIEHCLEGDYVWEDHQKQSLQKLLNTFS